MAFALHALRVAIECELVRAHEVVILPCASVSCVDAYARQVSELCTVGHDEDGAFDVPKRSRAVRLFLTVICRRSFPSPIRAFGRHVGITFESFCTLA